MIAFLVQRLYQAVLVMLTVGLIAFALFNYVGDPINSMVGQDTSLADRERLRQELGLNDSFIIQFARFVGRGARGEFGLSYQQARPVGQNILEKMPATLELSFVAATLALVIGVPMGIYTGLHRRSWLSQLLLGLSLMGVSLPTFLIGILLILVFAVVLGWLPSFGRGSVVQFSWWSSGLVTLDGWRAIILPAVTLALFQMTLIMRLVRAEMIEVLRTDYIKFARARGLTNRAVNFGHALKNSSIGVAAASDFRQRFVVELPTVTGDGCSGTGGTGHYCRGSVGALDCASRPV
jgi:peptide/nickel transport system permease protein